MICFVRLNIYDLESVVHNFNINWISKTAVWKRVSIQHILNSFEVFFLFHHKTVQVDKKRIHNWKLENEWSFERRMFNQCESRIMQWNPIILKRSPALHCFCCYCCCCCWSQARTNQLNDLLHFMQAFCFIFIDDGNFGSDARDFPSQMKWIVFQVSHTHNIFIVLSIDSDPLGRSFVRSRARLLMWIQISFVLATAYHSVIVVVATHYLAGYDKYARPYSFAI